MPDPDVVTQAAAAIGATVGAYGAKVLSRVDDAAADGTVRLGQRILARLVRQGRSPGVERAVRVLAQAEPDEAADAAAALRLELRAVLKADPQLRADVAQLLGGSDAVASGPRSIAVVGESSGINSTGDGAVNIQRR
jgi:succinate dehydrogenase/fumarate reductase flavoprotein subunit